jgi:hypothetical protein
LFQFIYLVYEPIDIDSISYFPKTQFSEDLISKSTNSLSAPFCGRYTTIVFGTACGDGAW